MMGNSISKNGILWLAMAGLLLSPAVSRAGRFEPLQPRAFESLQNPQDAQQRDQEQRDREQEARDKEQEKRDREEEARDRAQEKIDRQEELYDEGREALDDDHYEKAAAKFKQLAELNGPQTDAALYWQAYADNRLGRRDSSLAAIADLKKRFAQSRWIKDASALEIEVRQSTGNPVKPADQSDEELKMLALQGIMNSDPERGIPILEKQLTGTASPKQKSKALFVLAQTGSPQAMAVLEKVAMGQSNPDLERKAVEYLGIFGTDRATKTLGEVYASSKDAAVKRAVLRSYMISGNKEGLFAAAKNEKDESLKREAIRQLGISGGQGELQQLYQTETSTDLRREILQGFFLSGDSQKLVQVAQGEKDAELRRTAIRNLGLMGGENASKALQEIYGKESDRSVKEEVLNAYFLQGNAKGLIAIAKTEKDPGLKKVAVEKLSLMGSKEGTEYLMELLQK